MNNFEDLVNQNETENLLVTLDKLEEKIKLMDTIKKEHEDIKKKIKNAMCTLATNNKLEQVKWTTPKGIKITFSKGNPEELKKQIVEEFNIELLKEKYPSIYEDCLQNVEKLVTVKNESNDRLVITLSKD